MSVMIIQGVAGLLSPPLLHDSFVCVCVCLCVFEGLDLIARYLRCGDLLQGSAG
jgi:hypothetical protein